MTALMMAQEIEQMALITPLFMLILIFGMVGIAGVVCAMVFVLRTARRLPDRNEDFVLAELSRHEMWAIESREIEPWSEGNGRGNWYKPLH